MTTALKAPFPYFGGKRAAAPLIWDLLGDPGGYVEPFAGSAAVFLSRPPFTGLRVETLNDADGWLANVWRSLQLAPEEVAMHCVGPVSEIDYHARLAWLQSRRGDWIPSWLEGDPENYDAKAAAWWLYVVACGIGDPFGKGPWVLHDGRLVDSRKLDVDPTAPGVIRNMPHLHNDRGILTHGINREIPHLSSAGQGIASQGLGGVPRGMVHLHNDHGYLTSDNLTNYFLRLSRRLERVRITCGDWKRVVTPAVGFATRSNPRVGFLLDPPYETSGDLYHHGDTDGALSAEVREWCVNQEHNPDVRIVLCGYLDEHDELLDHGWTKHTSRAGGSGYGKGTATDKERLWSSPSCQQSQGTLL